MGTLVVVDGTPQQPFLSPSPLLLYNREQKLTTGKMIWPTWLGVIADTNMG